MSDLNANPVATHTTGIILLYRIVGGAYDVVISRKQSDGNYLRIIRNHYSRATHIAVDSVYRCLQLGGFGGVSQSGAIG